MLCIAIVFSSLFSGRRVNGLALLPNATATTETTTTTTTTTATSATTSTISPTTTTATTGSKIFSFSKIVWFSLNNTKNQTQPNGNVSANSQQGSKTVDENEIYIGMGIFGFFIIIIVIIFLKNIKQ